MSASGKPPRRTPSSSQPVAPAPSALAGVYPDGDDASAVGTAGLSADRTSSLAARAHDAGLRATRWYVGIVRLVGSALVVASITYLLARALTSRPWQLIPVIAGGVITELVILFRDRETRALIVWLTIHQWRLIDQDTPRAPEEAGRASLKVLAVMFTCAIVLTVQEYFGGADTFMRWFPPGRHPSKYYELFTFAWWSGWRVFGYVLIPMTVISLLPGERIRDYNLSPKGFFAHIWMYVCMYLAFLPVVYLASRTAEFRSMYPFYRMANRSRIDLFAWEAIYAAQFLSLEFFFRGFLLNGLRRAFGANAIFVMIVPYCMIHYGKPMPETIGAILAGLLLGTFAMRTRSIWGGVLIHLGVAIAMDVMAMRGCPPMGSGLFCHP